MEIDYYAIGRRIKKLRKAKNLSQTQLRDRTTISKTHMSHIETGTTKLSLPALIEIANALGVTTDQILSDNVEATTSVFRKDVEDILFDCTNVELSAMIETMSVVKKSMRKVQNNDSEY